MVSRQGCSKREKKCMQGRIYKRGQSDRGTCTCNWYPAPRTSWFTLLIRNLTSEQPAGRSTTRVSRRAPKVFVVVNPDAGTRPHPPEHQYIREDLCSGPRMPIGGSPSSTLARPPTCPQTPIRLPANGLSLLSRTSPPPTCQRVHGIQLPVGEGQHRGLAAGVGDTGAPEVEQALHIGCGRAWSRHAHHELCLRGGVRG